MERNWFNKDVGDVLNVFNTDLEKGLTNEQVEKNRKEYGLNELKAKKKKSLVIKFLEQFKDFIYLIISIFSISNYWMTDMG